MDIFGLGLGIFRALFIYLWPEDDSNYDNFQANSERLYRVMLNHKGKDRRATNPTGASTGLLAEAIKVA